MVLNQGNNQIGGMKFINSPHFEAGRKLRNRGTLVSQYGQEGHPKNYKIPGKVKRGVLFSRELSRRLNVLLGERCLPFPCQHTLHKSICPL